MKTIEGVVPVMLAPFTEDESLDLSAIGRMVEFAIACGARQTCLPAYGSEFYKLSEDERVQFVATAVKASAGRLMIMGQANHGSAKIAAELARKMEAAGADFISLALPRLFPIGEDDLVRYAARVADAISIPLMIQDFNPGGATVEASFCIKLHERCPNFRYIKLEEPRMASKMVAIHQGTNHGVGVLEGWGGLYMPELVPHGCVGSIPGYVLADVLCRVYQELKYGDRATGWRLFSEVTPFINFTLENFELYHHCEKQLLVERGVLTNAVVRDFTTYLDPVGQDYLNFLAERLWETLDRWGLKKRPLD